MNSVNVKSRFIKWCLRHFTKIYDDYKPVKHVFEEPALYCVAGRWTKDPCLPIWRRGKTIHIFGHKFTMPVWLSFYIFNRKMGWKPKWDEYRYEWPPQFTMVFFGLSISFWLKAEETYWESILYFTDPDEMSGTLSSYYRDTTRPIFNDNIIETGIAVDHWGRYDKKKDEWVYWWALNPLWLKQPFYGDWREYILKNK